MMPIIEYNISCVMNLMTTARDHDFSATESTESHVSLTRDIANVVAAQGAAEQRRLAEECVPKIAALGAGMSADERASFANGAYMELPRVSGTVEPGAQMTDEHMQVQQTLGVVTKEGERRQLLSARQILALALATYGFVPAARPSAVATAQASVATEVAQVVAVRPAYKAENGLTRRHVPAERA